MLSLYNTLTKQVEEIRTVEPGVARMYTCGPTVYRYAHIGNLRTYLMADWIRRALTARGLRVEHVKNITDVGHMRQELVEAGGDKMILSALAEGKSVEQIAQFYEDSFHRDEARVNILPAAVFPRATRHVTEMVGLVRRLLDNQLAYQAGGNVYFAVGRFPEYGKLSRNVGSDLLEGVRVETDPLKQDPRDFTLWKAAEPGRDLKWDSPWGPGFPGWHIECSAMAHKYLGERFDIHTGGVDNVFPHHEDEIAQSEGAFGHQHVSYWVHGQHLLADGAKMSKSAGNVFLLDDLIARGFDPLAFRYLCLTVRYRHRMNFTFTALKASERALTALRHRVWTWKSLGQPQGRASGADSSLRRDDVDEWRQLFWAAVEHDLDLPGGLAVTWDMVRSELPEAAKLALLLEFDQVFGLDLDRVPAAYRLPGTVAAAMQQRHALRQQADYAAADSRRAAAQAVGYQVEDTMAGARVRPKSSLEQREERWPSVSSGREVESLLDQPAKFEFTLLLNAYDYQDDVERCVNAMLRYSRGYSAEILVVDNGSTDGSAQWLESMQSRHPGLRVIHCDHVLGDAAGKNIGIKQSLGAHLVLLDSSTEIVGDVLDPIRRRLADPSVGVFGPYGLTSADFKHFHDDVVEGEADAVQGYCMAFRREAVNRVGLMRECFRFYRNLDIDYCFQFKEKGYRIVADGRLPLVRHEHRQWSELDEGQRNELSRKNFGRFLKRWGHRGDLLVSGPPAPAHHHDHDHDHDHGHDHTHHQH